MQIINHASIATEDFPGGATYKTLVGNDAGSTPVRCGIQTSPPGYETPNHAHPYAEIITVLAGSGEAWIEGDVDPTEIGVGMTMIIPPNTSHGFRVTGTVPLVTYGIHTSPNRVVEIKDPPG